MVVKVSWHQAQVAWSRDGSGSALVMGARCAGPLAAVLCVRCAPLLASARSAAGTHDRGVMAATETEQVGFGILGTLEVRVGGVPIAMRQGLTRSVLLALLLRPNQTVSTDLLIEDLYGEELPAHPLNALQVQVSYLRKILSDAGMEDMLRTEGTGYRLVVERTAVDSGQFELLIDQARRLADEATSDDLPEALECVDEALALWRGSPLEDVAHRDFAVGEIARLAELRLSARELRAELHLALGHHREIVPDLAALSEEHPLRERAHELLMVALYRAGRQADALREYEATRRTLGDELGLEPGPELRRLERAILDHDPDLDWVPHPAAADRCPTPASAAPTSSQPLHCQRRSPVWSDESTTSSPSATC